MTHPNRLVKVPDIGALAEEIGRIRGQDEVGRLEMPRKLQDARHKRLSGAVELPRVYDLGERLGLRWLGHDWHSYGATLVGLDYNKSCAVVTDVIPTNPSPPRRNPSKAWDADYKAWKAKYGPWF